MSFQLIMLKTFNAAYLIHGLVEQFDDMRPPGMAEVQKTQEQFFANRSPALPARRAGITVLTVVR